MLTGIDFSFGSGVTVAQIKAAGYQFVCRYLSGGNSKDIDALEVSNYKAGGMPIVFVWETSGNEFTFTQGVNDAKAAVAELANVGASGATIFFAQDVPVAAGTNPVAYMQGVNSVIGFDRSGGYGDFAVIQSLFNAGVIKYGWQTSGGSGGLWDGRALLRQVSYNVSVGPATCDVDQAAFWTSTKVLGFGDDFGQYPRPVSSDWTYGPPGLTINVVGHTSVKFTTTQPSGAPTPADHVQVFMYDVSSGSGPNAGNIVSGYPRDEPFGTAQTGSLVIGHTYVLHAVAAGVGDTHVGPGVYASATFTTG